MRPIAVTAVVGAVFGALAACSGNSPILANRPAATADVAPPTPELMASLGRGEPTVASLIDPSAGLRYAAYYTDPSEQDPRADETGLVKVAELACGDRAAELAAELANELGAGGEPWRCDELAVRGQQGPTSSGDNNWQCYRPAPGEYGLDSRYTFAARAGALRLVEVVQIEGGPVTEAFAAEGRSWAAGALAALPATCP